MGWDAIKGKSVRCLPSQPLDFWGGLPPGCPAWVLSGRRRDFRERESNRHVVYGEGDGRATDINTTPSRTSSPVFPLPIILFLLKTGLPSCSKL